MEWLAHRNIERSNSGTAEYRTIDWRASAGAGATRHDNPAPFFHFMPAPAPISAHAIPSILIIHASCFLLPASCFVKWLWTLDGTDERRCSSLHRCCRSESLSFPFFFVPGLSVPIVCGCDSFVSTCRFLSFDVLMFWCV